MRTIVDAPVATEYQESRVQTMVASRKTAVPTRRALSAAFASVLLAVLAAGCFGCQESGPLVTVYHPPEHFGRRVRQFSANVTGELSERVESARFRVNDGPWAPLPQGGHRSPPPLFIIEMEFDQLHSGTNRLEIEATGDGSTQNLDYDFTYDPQPPSLPLEANWSTEALVVEDGSWERLSVDEHSWRVRPVPGTEGYDRVLIVAPAFAGGRRIETEMTYRYHVDGGEWGFGFLTFWGGRPEDESFRPKRGWQFGLAWYFNRYRGVGGEFSTRYGVQPYSFTTAYQDYVLEQGTTYRIIAEARREVDGAGRFRRFDQRMKWWPTGEPEPEAWMVLADDQRLPLPDGDYGVAFICFRTQVELGTVTVASLPDLIRTP